jgi:hypothetical protein
MKKLLIFILIAMPLLTFGQKVDRQVIAAGGDYFEATSTNISWTLGELATESFTTGNLFFSQGFHQGNMEVTPIRGLQAEFELKAYPNPVMDILIVETEKLDLKYRLINMDGKVLENGTINSSSYELDFTSFPSGMYFLWVEENQTHKIIKN